MGKEKKSKTEVVESQLSEKQASILRDREKFYQKFTQPALKDYYNATRSFELRDDFTSLDDLSDQLDSIFSDDPEQQMLGQALFTQGFDLATQEAARAKMQGAQSVAKEGTYSAANLAAMQKANQDVARQNQLRLKEQEVRESGISALLGQAPQATQAGSPVMTTTEGGGDGLGALGGAVGSMIGGMDFGGETGGIHSFGSDLGGSFDFSTGSMTGSGGFNGSGALLSLGGRGASTTPPNFTGQGMFR